MYKNRKNSGKSNRTIVTILFVISIFVLLPLIAEKSIDTRILKNYNKSESPKFVVGDKVYYSADLEKKVGVVIRCYILGGIADSVEFDVKKKEDGSWNMKTQDGYKYEIRFPKHFPNYSNIDNLNIVNTQAASSSTSSLIGGKSSSFNQIGDENIFVTATLNECELEKYDKIINIPVESENK